MDAPKERVVLGLRFQAGIGGDSASMAGGPGRERIPERRPGRSPTMKDRPMLRSIKDLYGDTLGASDGEIGKVKDIYFDDQNWAVRYLVVDTGSWLSGRTVLISPHAFGRLDQQHAVLRVFLTRKQIEGSPSIETHKTVSRQYEEDYYSYYGWPFYWQGSELWGMNGYPVVDRAVVPSVSEWDAAHGRSPEARDAHLRSAQAVTGYQIQAQDGLVGHISDLIIDDQTWAIRQLVIKTGSWFSGKEVNLPVSRVTQISYEKSTVSVDLSRKQVEQGLGTTEIPKGMSVIQHQVDESVARGPKQVTQSKLVTSNKAAETPQHSLTPPRSVVVGRVPASVPTDVTKTALSTDAVAKIAYFNYVDHGSQPGNDVQHWLAAEAQLRRDHQSA